MEKYGYDRINDAFLNKGTAFSAEERKKYHLEGLLPPCIDDIETQADRIYRQMERKTSKIEKKKIPHGCFQSQPNAFLSTYSMNIL